MTKVSAHVLHNIEEIDAKSWDEHANPAPNSEISSQTNSQTSMAFDPFVSHQFLLALEKSGSATRETGWQPMHLVLRDEDKVLGVMPAYLKSHSQGEYVFDYAWADAWHRAGGNYYPKLQSSIPFTPASGRRLLTRHGDSEVEKQLLSAYVQLAEQLEVSSAHLTFLPEGQWVEAGKLGYLRRIDQQFHWCNNNYTSFDDFLGALSSKKRKNLKRERRDALANDITIERLTGSDLREEHWDTFYAFYLDTGSRKWGSPYLTRDFFSQIQEHFSSHTLLVLAKRNNRYIAGALNFIGGDTLFGRNWGCIEDHPFLHFELCYYQAIEFAIEHKLSRVEAGAQGGHKLARGYLPQSTYSAHWIRDSGFRSAVENFLKEERRYVKEDIEMIGAHSPFKQDSPPS